MSSDSLEYLENLAKIGKLKKEPPLEDELEGLHESGVARLADAERRELAFASRFDLAYNAAHAIALYALRRLGFRSENRLLVFETLVHTVGLDTAKSRTSSRLMEDATEPSTRDTSKRTNDCCLK